MGLALNMTQRGRLALPLFFVICLLALPVWAADDNAVNWYACTQNDDCVRADGVCRRMAVNKAYLKEHLADVEINRPLSSCMQPTQAEITHDATADILCMKGQCKIAPMEAQDTDKQ